MEVSSIDKWFPFLKIWLPKEFPDWTETMVQVPRKCLISFCSFAESVTKTKTVDKSVTDWKTIQKPSCFSLQSSSGWPIRALYHLYSPYRPAGRGVCGRRNW